MSDDLKGYVNNVNVEELVSDVAWEVGERIAGFVAKQVVKKVPIMYIAIPTKVMSVVPQELKRLMEQKVIPQQILQMAIQELSTE